LFTYNTNNKGHNIDPCGTPDWTFSIFDSANPNLTFKEMENSNFTGILFLDFRKAFDVVNHKILYTKLKYYKCDDLTISWIKSY
jgi:hypothetical protein